MLWSENRYVDLLINALLFLLGINLFHYGQLLLPVICLIIFIDRKLQFKVNDPLIFIVLCLFAISFYAFSYRQGFYSVMGFCLPMAYYIGSNVKEPDEDKIKKIIYILMFAMASHLLLNVVYEYIVHDPDHFFHASTHLDIWTGGKVASTLLALDLDLLIGSLYYLVFHERNRFIRLSAYVIFVICMFYLIVIGRRTQILILGLVFTLSFIYETFVLKSVNDVNRRRFLILVSLLIGSLILLSLVYFLDLFGLKTVMDNTYIVMKIRQSFSGDERTNVLFASFKLMLVYLFGGSHISETLGLQVHNLWLDIYDYAGIVPFLLMDLYSLMFIRIMMKIHRSDRISNSFKVLTAGLLICIFVQLNLEPAMTGASLFVIITILLGALWEGLANE